MKKVMIAAGGTGGHIYPAQALGSDLQKLKPHLEIAFIAGGLKTNPYFKKQAFPFFEVASGKLYKNNPLKTLKSAFQIVKGILESIRIMRRYRPDLIIGFGSFYTFPPLLAAKFLRIPIVLHEANAVPGKVNRLLSRHATVTGVYFPEAIRTLKGPTVVVEMPLRVGYKSGEIQKEEALKYFSLDPHKKTLLVFGGSQGASRINQILPQAITKMKDQYQVIHFTGHSKTTSDLIKQYSELGIKACVKDYENQMEFALALSDLVISRAGAGTIAELIEFEVPAILIPYPYASDNHQEFNADHVVNRVGGAIKLTENNLTVENLQKEINAIEEKSFSFKQNFQNYKKSLQRENFSILIIKILTGGYHDKKR